MPRKYEPRSLTIESLLNWIKSGEIAIPEIQRPFVWSTTQVRDFLDSLFKDFPVGYLITWKSPDVNLKDGSRSEGKKILIDGQQRITALMAALLGVEITTKSYKRVRIRISFNPQEHKFEVYNSAIAKDPAWIPDIKVLFDPNTKLLSFINEYCGRNPETDLQDIHDSIHALKGIITNPIGIIELDSSLDIETVTEIFIRVNSAGVPLSQADFAMSKIAVNAEYDGSNLRKAIDYFCHLAVSPELLSTIERNDPDFSNSDYFRQMQWLQRENDDLFDPSYNDMLRVAFTAKFRRGRLQDLVALLSGRNFETKRYEEDIIADTFDRLKQGIAQFMNETNFKRFVMIIKSAGFIDSSLISSQIALNFAYILFLTLRDQGVSHVDIEHHVRRWFVMSLLTKRYSGSPETTIDSDIRQIDSYGIGYYAEMEFRSQLSDAFWDYTLPLEMETSAINSPSFNVYRAAQVKLNDKGFLSPDMSVKELIEYKSDVHHIFPRDVLKKRGLSRGEYNQIANYVITQTEINSRISNKEPAIYFNELLHQANGGSRLYGNIANLEDLLENLEMNCIPESVFEMTVDDYPAFLQERRKLMSQKIKTYFKML